MGTLKKAESNHSRNSRELSTLKRQLVIEYRPVSTLRPDPRNPRRHTERQVRQIAKSIEVFGFNVPILINADMQVIAGHGRLQACKLIGVTEVPTIRLENLSDAQASAFLIADNRLTENSEWDHRILGEQLSVLSAAELDFKLDVIGFELGEIELFVENLAPATKGTADPADALPAPRAKSPVTQGGDRWILNRHRVGCDDARNGSTYSALMQGRPAEMVFTAPPYKDPTDGRATELGHIHHQDAAAVSDKISRPEFIRFLTNVATHLGRHSANGALHYICVDWRQSAELLAAARSVYTDFKDLCVWVKQSAGHGSLYRSQHELVFVFQVGKKPLRNSNQPEQYGRCRTNVWNYKEVNPQIRSANEGAQATSYTPALPVELVADAILDCTTRGEVVLDPFLGSGTTVIAAERTGRVCYGIELSPARVDAIVRRWQAFTGQSAINESTRKSFSEIEEENHERTE